MLNEKITNQKIDIQSKQNKRNATEKWLFL